MQLKFNLAISFEVFLIKNNNYYIYYSMCVNFQSLQAAYQNPYIAKATPMTAGEKGHPVLVHRQLITTDPQGLTASFQLGLG